MGIIGGGLCIAPSKTDSILTVQSRMTLNDDRVRVAHGMWTLGRDGLVARHVQRSSLQPQYFFEKRNELGRLAEEAQRLMQAVLTIGN